MKIKNLIGLLLILGFVLAIQPAESWTSGPQNKFTPANNQALTTEGGNVTELNISQDISTEKWAGLWGNLSGNILLSDGTSNFYIWTWSPSNGGVVCAQPSSTANFDWSAAAATTAGEVDAAFSFTTTDTDSATNTLTETCSLTISGTSITGAPAVTASGFQTCSLEDTSTLPTKSDLAFCTSITTGTTLFNGGTGDYALMIPTTESAGSTETYVFWLELQ